MLETAASKKPSASLKQEPLPHRSQTALKKKTVALDRRRIADVRKNTLKVVAARAAV